ncbi:gamma-glutamyltransferase family protein [Xinfangfangia sp. CPCC 101601]|uniref:Gamma-glutamyltransferase family protein n=1 Tax=Pseudogemmobacter lacusdianii TaxID=3069608 RepID=A0ABU0VXD1_9RHOB|nr:gamma-glutamyltransferase family protein [Xinfangfangia sp. CPCC 101601]MDQ2066278.1 gamma-glutamyltransferase family protein [Xinfangfangia sp. CPCC 101601]
MRDFHLAGRSTVHAMNGMVATSHPLASLTAIDTLRAGGNAVDAALAAAFVLGLAEPQMTGIGGDCFVLLKPAGTEDVIGLNGSGRAPAGLSAERLRAEGHATMPLHGVLPVTLPGAIDAFCRLHTDHGSQPLDQILAPAIAYAEAGIPVAPRTAFDWADDLPVLQGRAREIFSFSGAAPRAGQLYRNPLQAEVLRRIAREGRKGFYEGEVAEDMIASLRALGGCHTLDDLAATACNYTTPISGNYNGLELLEHPPNGQGATAILMLNILKRFDIAKLSPHSAQRAHLEAEAAKLAYDARNRFIADPAQRLDHMLSAETADRLAALIDPDYAMANAAPLTEAVHKDTVYLTVVDRDRMAISLIYSIFWGFGSGLASDKFGINFQNRGAGFTLQQGHPNEAAGGKRPMHTIIPGMIRQNGRVTMPFGVMGGAYQPAGHAHFVSNLADFGMDPQEAIDAPRSFAGSEGLEVERGYTDEARRALAAMGHAVTIPGTPLGGAQAILIGEDGGLTGASDPRKDGCALGY